MNIATLMSPRRRELAQRSNAGLEITLYWHPYDNGTSIDVHELAIDETISFPRTPRPGTGGLQPPVRLPRQPHRARPRARGTRRCIEELT
jgi:hypothetical protein